MGAAAAALKGGSKKKKYEKEDPNTQWRKPKDIKDIKKQNEARRKEEEAAKKAEEEAQRRREEALAKKGKGKKGKGKGKDGKGGETGKGGGQPEQDLGACQEQYGGQQYAGYEEEGEEMEGAAEAALKRAEFGLFDIMEHQEVVPSEYAKQNNSLPPGPGLAMGGAGMQAPGMAMGGAGMQSPMPSSGSPQGANHAKIGTGFGGKKKQDLPPITVQTPGGAQIGIMGGAQSMAIGGAHQGGGIMALGDDMQKHEKLQVNNLENTLVDAASKVWEQILREQKAKGVGNKVVVENEQLSLPVLKKKVEENAKKLEKFENDLETFEQEKFALIHELDQVVEKIEPNGIPGDTYEWKNGEMCIRKGKLCEVIKIHMSEDPPYFEVKAYYGGDQPVGTEAGKLKALSPVQAGQVRAKMRAIEHLDVKVKLSEEGKREARAELKKFHEKLVGSFNKLQSSPGNKLPPPSTGGFIPVQKPVNLNATGAFNMTRGFNSAIPQPKAPWRPGAAPKGMPTMATMQKWLPKDQQQQQQTYSPEPGQRGYSMYGAGSIAEDEEYGGHSQTTRRPSAQPGDMRAGLPSLERMQTDQLRWEEEAAAKAANTEALKAAQEEARAAAAQRAQYQGTKWIPYSTEEGQTFYYNEQTGESAWELPEGAEIDYSNWDTGQALDPDVDPETGMTKAEEDAYYQQYGYANKAAYEQAYAEAQQQQEADPFAHLRQHDAQQQQQSDEWAEWYKQYAEWYKTQNAAHGWDYNAAQGQQQQQQQPQQEQQKPGHIPGKAAPNAKPIIDERFEDKAVYLIKSALMKEMEGMIASDLPMDERKKALRKLKFQWHPDKNPEDAEVAKDIFQFIEESKGWFLDGAD